MSLGDTLSDLGWNDFASQEAVLQIMHYTGCFTGGILPVNLYSPEEVNATLATDMNIEQVNDLMQRYMLRKTGAERQMLPHDERYDCLKSRYETLDFLQDIRPTRGEYDAILLLGCSFPSFQERTSLLRTIFQEGVNGTTYLLGSDRELWPIHEPPLTTIVIERADPNLQLNAERLNQIFKEKLTAQIRGDTALTAENEKLYLEQVRTNPAILNSARAEINRYIKEDLGIAIPTEADMMNEIFESLCPGHEHVKIEAKQKPNGKRANTEDTIIEFLKIYPKKVAQENHILLISSQPVAIYQKEATKIHLSSAEGYVVEVAAKGLRETFNAATIHDSLARIVYSMKLQKEQRLEADL